jgi:hypothetical protein
MTPFKFYNRVVRKFQFPDNNRLETAKPEVFISRDPQANRVVEQVQYKGSVIHCLLSNFPDSIPAFNGLSAGE